MNLGLQLSYFAALQGTTRRSSLALRWLIRLGGIGLFGVAIIDSSMIPIPLPGSTDLLLLFLSAHRGASVVLVLSYVAWAFAGSVIGGYLTWGAGAKGGEAALEKLGHGRMVDSAIRWVKRNGMASVAVAALLPPPVPLMPFLLAAGALGLSRARFLVSYCSARLLRYSFVGWLGYKCGRHIVVLWEKELKGWTTPILVVYFSLVALGAAYGLWKFMKDRRK